MARNRHPASVSFPVVSSSILASPLLDEILRCHSSEPEDHTPPLRVTLPWEVRRPLSRLNVRLEALQDLGPRITARTHPAVCRPPTCVREPQHRPFALGGRLQLKRQLCAAPFLVVTEAMPLDPPPAVERFDGHAEDRGAVPKTENGD